MTRPLISTSITFSSSIQASILSPETRTRTRYHRPSLNSRPCVVSFSDASMWSMFESPITIPPQPPTIRLHADFPTGNVRPQKKSLPVSFIASSVIS